MKKYLALVLSALALIACNHDDPNPPTKQTTKGSITGFVTDKKSGAVIKDVTVKASGNEFLTGDDGSYEINDIDTGEVTFSAIKTGYASYSGKVAVTDRQSTSQNIILAPIVETNYKSCLGILNAGENTGDGFYSIDADGDGPLESFDVYCNMSIEGGGWTLFANHKDGMTTVTTVDRVTLTENGTMQNARWQTLRDNINTGMLFIDENNLVSMISNAKIKNGNCRTIGETNNLTELTIYPHSLWHNENSGCSATGGDYTLAILAGDDYAYYAIAGASIFQGSDQKFDIWPYISQVSSEVEQNELQYYLK